MDKSVVVCDWLLLKNVVIRNFYLTTFRMLLLQYYSVLYKVSLHGWSTLSVGGPQLVQSVQDTSSSNMSMPCTCFAIN